jgi:lipid-A-disaccharide synthase
MKYYIIAGERSGDLHGSNLIKELKRQDKDALIRCWGGDLMKKAGGELAMHYKETAFMGLWEAIANTRKILGQLSFCKKDILSFKPDAVVLIDYPGFNLQIAKFTKEKGYKVIYYISPKIWAWNKGRIKTIKAYVDLMLVVLPFEKEFYQKYDYQVEYVGNPVLDAVKAHRVSLDFFEKNELPDDKTIIALLPGSRQQEIEHMLPVFCETALFYPDYHFVLAAVKHVDPGLYAPVSSINNITLVYERAYDILAYSDAAVVVSGTATLETALWDVPQVVVYKTSGFTYFLAKMVVKVKYISLVNLIADKEVVKELIQHDMKVEFVAKELNEILTNKERRQFIVSEYNKIKEKLKDGKASYLAAKNILKFLRKEEPRQLSAS